MMNYGSYWGSAPLGMGIFGGVLGAFLIPMMLWSVAWKGWALWKASKADSKVWFIILLFVNTIGILDILYIFVFSKEKKASKKVK